MSKKLSVKLLSDHSPERFEGAVNAFLADHEVVKVSYSTVSTGATGEIYPLYTVLILYYAED